MELVRWDVTSITEQVLNQMVWEIKITLLVYIVQNLKYNGFKPQTSLYWQKLACRKQHQVTCLDGTTKLL